MFIGGEMKWWQRLVGCNNRYQSFSDWFIGRWQCPQCKKWWSGTSICDDLTLAEVEGRKVKKWLKCPECGFVKNMGEVKESKVGSVLVVLLFPIIILFLLLLSLFNEIEERWRNEPKVEQNQNKKNVSRWR